MVRAYRILLECYFDLLDHKIFAFQSAALPYLYSVTKELYKNFAMTWDIEEEQNETLFLSAKLSCIEAR